MLAVFVPASTMRLVAEEQRDGTLEILLTQPIMVWTILLAKFTAGLLFVGAGIAATVVIPLALQTAGDFDDGAIVAQYIGTFFLTASFVAVGLFTSSLTRNQIVAFIMGFIIIMLLMLAGSGLVTLAVPPAAAVLVQDLSPSTHFGGIARGVLDLRDVLYFVALISTFLSATYLMIRGKSVSRRSPLYRNLQLGVGGLVVVSVLIGWWGSSIGGRWDLTENQLFTLSDASAELLRDLDDIVVV
jgi:ABC-2 type transport system permease protein